MIFLERIRENLSMAVMLKDDLTPDKMVIGEVFIKVPGAKKSPIKHNTGYFLLLDLPDGRKYSIIAGGKFYKEKEYKKEEIDPKSLNPQQPFVDVFIEPNAGYPFPEGLTVLKGKIVDLEYKPIPDVTIKVKDMAEDAISEGNGDFFIHFKIFAEDKNITLKINKDGYEAKEMTILLKKRITTRIGIIKLIPK